jgi:hypothetical protein
MKPLSEGRVARPLAVLGGALALCWPALLNRYPLLYPDSISYIGEGRAIAHSLFIHRLPEFSGMRSEMYSLGIFPWHWNMSPWGIVALHALVTAWVLWLVVRSIAPDNTARRFLVIVAALSLLTSVSWYVSLVMPDVLGAALYLCLYLLVFARGTLSKWEHGAVAVLAVWAVTAHATHLLLAAGLCAMLALLLALRCTPMRGRLRGVGEVALVVVMAAVIQIALHGYLYGKPTLSGNRVPYLMARVIADGPGRLYLEQNCSHLDWAICDHVHTLPDNDDAFLWADGGIWPTSSPSKQARLLNEEMPLVLGTVRAYPLLQLKTSLRNFAQQLNDFGVDDFDNNTWMEGALNGVMPGSQASYERSLQARDAVPSHLFTELQRWVVFTAAAVVLGFVPWLWRRRASRLFGVALIVVPVIVANAFVTAVLSTIDSRYQSRVIWLLPLLAALLLTEALKDRRKALPGRA